MKQRVLVTGGAGFIGSHIAERLLELGATVTALDNLSSGFRSNIPDGATFVEGDLGDLTLLETLLKNADAVVHQAAIPSVHYSVEFPDITHKANLTATVDLLNLCRSLPIRRVVFASSSAVYGNTATHPVHERVHPQPLTPYALQKYTSEQYAQLFTSLYGLETVCLRYFNVFGPRQSNDSPYSGVITKFCSALLSGTPPTIYGDGQQSRDFVYIKDVVEANILALSAPFRPGPEQVVNIGSGQSTTLLQLLQKLSRISGTSLAPRFLPGRPGDIKSSAADINLAKDVLNYVPRTVLEDGLISTYKYFLHQVERPT